MYFLFTHVYTYISEWPPWAKFIAKLTLPTDADIGKALPIRFGQSLTYINESNRATVSGNTDTKKLWKLTAEDVNRGSGGKTLD